MKKVKTPSGKVVTEFLFKSGIEYKEEFTELAEAKRLIIDFIRHYTHRDEHYNNPLIVAHCYQKNIKKGYVVYANAAFKLTPKMLKGSKLDVPFIKVNGAFKDVIKAGRSILYNTNEEIIEI